MTRRLPPLNALRVFEVAARHLSFTKAANELCVTNAAVSHQIKLLEQYLDLKLFERRNNQLQLSSAGENYLPRVRDAFRALQQATEMLLGDKSAVLHVAVPQTLGAKWLVPRLYRFINLHPDIRIEVSTERVVEYRDFDVVIDDRRLNDKHLTVERFASTRFFPVCSPALQHRLQTPQDLTRLTLLHERGAQRLAHHPTWQQWLDEVNVSGVEIQKALGFSDATMTMQAAIDGQGVALGQEMLVEYDIAAGRLVKPLEVEVSLCLYYYLIFPHEVEEKPAFQAFRRWLAAEAAHG
ncbi:transcriptional regulator GcvA [Paludibacterium yongneupense]|uniref:transcriptional regulator GcvA n=1 Tax=Paludibacterium yongneupense TaxID=400061 RepID=UPI000420C7E0|nr:transcriptional regulator GcvA [Paludibacterium yongneupense]